MVDRRFLLACGWHVQKYDIHELTVIFCAECSSLFEFLAVNVYLRLTYTLRLPPPSFYNYHKLPDTTLRLLVY